MPTRLGVASGAASGFDSSAYRANTYGNTPDYYCDCTRSLASSGAGTLGDPYNLNQAMAVAGGSLVWFLPMSECANGTPVQMSAPNSVQTAAFNPTNSGSSGNPTVFVTKYAAATLSRTGIGTNTNRTELRHAGTAAAATGDTETGTGGPCIGANAKNYIIYDGFYIDMAQAEIKGDSGVFQPRDATAVHFKNLHIKGKTTNCQSNAVVYRPHNAVSTYLYNILAYDFSNDPTGSNVPQAALFSDQYGDQDFLMEHFEIDNIDMGIFLKGTTPGPIFNYGTIRYGVVKNSSSFFRFNDLDPTNVTTVQYCLTYNSIGSRPKPLSPDGWVFDVISSSPRNITIDHCTLAKVDSTDLNINAALYYDPGAFSFGSGVTITNNVIDMDNGSNGHMVAFTTSLPGTMNYNVYTKNGGNESWVYNSVQYDAGQNGDFAGWKTATSLDANSQELASINFTDRTNDVYTIASGNALTASSTGGQVGCYAAGVTIGIET